MPKTKISEYSATANSNTDVGGINIDEGCAPSGINDAIRTMMAQLKNFQTGTGSDSFNGPVGSTTASTGAFTTLTASGNVTLGDASTDTLNVGNGGIVKDASGNVGLGTAAGNAKLSVETGSTYAAIFGTSSTSAGTTRISFGNYLSGAGGGAGSAAIGGVHNHGSSSLSSLAFYTHNGTSLGEVGRFDSAGNLGLGVTPQSWLSTSRVLQLGSGGAVEARSNYEPYLSITSNAYLNTAGTYKYIATAEAARYLQDAGTHKFFIAPSGSAGADITTFTQAMTLNASGNLGVGATSPSSGGGGGLTLGTTSAGKSFHVFSSSYASNGLGNFYGTDGNMKLQMGALSNTSAYIYANTGCDLVLYSGGSVSATLNAAGNLGLGVTPSASNASTSFEMANGSTLFARTAAPQFGLMVNAVGNWYEATYKTTAAANMYLLAGGQHQWYNAPSGTAGNAITFTQAMTLTAEGNLLVGTTSSGARLRVQSQDTSSSNYGLFVTDSSGNLLLGTRNDSYVRAPAVYTQTSASAANVVVDSSGYMYRSTSALKYKQDIRDLESIDIGLFRAIRYKSKCENDDQTKDHFGVIADEVDAAGIKELVNYGENGEIEGFQYERLTVVLLKEIQSLRKRLTALESK